MAENIFKNESAAKLQNQVADLQETISSMERTHAELSQRYNQVNSDRGNLETSLKRSEAQVADLMTQVSHAKRRGEALEQAEVERDQAITAETISTRALSALNREYNTLEERANHLQEQLSSTQSKLQKASEQIDPLTKLVLALQARITNDKLIEGYLQEIDLATD